MEKLSVAERLEIWKKSKDSRSRSPPLVKQRQRSAPIDQATLKKQCLSKATKRTSEPAFKCGNNAESHSDSQNCHPNHERQPFLNSKGIRKSSESQSLENGDMKNVETLLALAVKEMEGLKQELIRSKMEANQALECANLALERQREAETRCEMSTDDIHALRFENSILHQKMEEMDEKCSQYRMDQNERIARKDRKQKADMKRLMTEKSEYEDRANKMIQQLNDQLMNLQQLAMQRIQTLEQELMEERNSNDLMASELRLAKASLQASRLRSLSRHENVEINDSDAVDGDLDEDEDCDADASHDGADCSNSDDNRTDCHEDDCEDDEITLEGDAKQDQHWEGEDDGDDDEGLNSEDCIEVLEHDLNVNNSFHYPVVHAEAMGESDEEEGVDDGTALVATPTSMVECDNDEDGGTEDCSALVIHTIECSDGSHYEVPGGTESGHRQQSGL